MSADKYVVGKCQEMCPLQEQRWREKEELVHILEKGNKQMVKCYHRSAAGLKMTDPSLIRPPDVLDSTVTYLFNTILCDENIPYSQRYEFLDDRLRSVKQDLFIQQPPAELCFSILEPIVRYYVYSAYRLGNAERKYFDPVLNHNQLLETLKWLLNKYAEVDYISEARFEMESIYLVLNLGEPKALMRSLGLDKCIRQKLIKKCEGLSMAWYIGNYVRVFKEFLELPILHSALICAHQLPYVRRYALNVLNSAYNSKNLTVPLSAIKSLLFYNNEDELVYDCNLFGIQIVDSMVKAVHFNKNSWKANDLAPKFLQNPVIEERLKNIHLPDLILCGGSTWSWTNESLEE